MGHALDNQIIKYAPFTEQEPSKSQVISAEHCVALFASHDVIFAVIATKLVSAANNTTSAVSYCVISIVHSPELRAQPVVLAQLAESAMNAQVKLVVITPQKDASS